MADLLHAHCWEHHRAVSRQVRSSGTDAGRAMGIAQSAAASASACVARSSERERSSNATRNAACHAGELAAGALRYWESETTSATERVGRARVWVARCEARLRLAVDEYHGARSRLADLQQRLQECRQPQHYRDSQGNYRTVHRDCSALEQAVYAAQQSVAAARSEVDEAESELGRASAELQASEAWLVHCRQCVGQANRAIELAASAVREAADALGESSRAVEYASCSVQAAQNSLSEASTALTLAEQAMVETSVSRRLLDEATVHRKNALAVAGESVILCMDAVRFADDRIEALIAFDRSMPGGAS